jgi:DNA-binding beta-propeller fold protein YncE
MHQTVKKLNQSVMVMKKCCGNAGIAVSVLTVFILVMSGISGCAPVQKPEIDISKLVWPPPPAKARIKFVRVLRTNLDVEESELASKIFGARGVSLALAFPNAVASDGEGLIYVSHRFGVALFDLANKKVRSFATETGLGSIRRPRGIALAPDGRVFIVDAAKKSIFVYSKKNKFIMKIGSARELTNPIGIALDVERSRIYVTDSKKYEIHAYDLDGNYLFKFEDAGGAPVGIAVNSEGTVYVADQILGRVIVYNNEGKYRSDIGSLGDKAGNFARPKDVGIDSEDNVYVVDAAFGNYQIFDKEGRLLLWVAEGGSEYGQMVLPVGIHIDRHDRIYVAERANHRVQIFQYLSKKYYEEHPEEVPEEEEVSVPEEVSGSFRA